MTEESSDAATRPALAAAAYPHPSSAHAQKVMRANRRRNTKPESAVRSVLHRRGHRFRKDHLLRVEGMRTHPDIVFTRQKVAVYIDGCFWHRCPEHGTMPTSNAAYWEPKLARNAARDERATAALRAAGWTVIRIWEHVDAVAAADRVEDALERGALEPSSIRAPEGREQLTDPCHEA